MNLKKPFTTRPQAGDKTHERSSHGSRRWVRVGAVSLSLLLTVPLFLPVATSLGTASPTSPTYDTALSLSTEGDSTADTAVSDPATDTNADTAVESTSEAAPAGSNTARQETETIFDVESLLPESVLEARPAEPPTVADLPVLSQPPATEPSGEAVLGPVAGSVGEDSATTEGGDETGTQDPSSDPSVGDTAAPLTQESIARSLETDMDLTARSGTRVSFPFPAGSMAVDLQKDGRRVLQGQVVDIGGTVYVPVQRFADLFGKFKTVYTAATEQVVITGTNLSVTVKVGDPYITVNERIFYTGKNVLSLRGWIFVPLSSMTRAMGATVTIRSGYYDAKVTSGDPTAVASASTYYNSSDLYWLSRIISAESRGEPLRGQIAVGNVILNRVRSSQFPNTIYGVIFDRKYGVQFSPVSYGTIYNTPTASAIMAAKICLEGYTLSSRILYFYNPAIATSSWIANNRPYIMTIGNHKFYA